jgi:hypothetical protein
MSPMVNTRARAATPLDLSAVRQLFTNHLAPDELWEVRDVVNVFSGGRSARELEEQIALLLNAPAVCKADLRGE